MNGVIIDATFAMRFTPPTITTPSRAARIMPDVSVDTGNALCIVDEAPLDCTIVRHTAQAMMVITAKTIPSQRWRSPSSKILNGPPRYPLEWRNLYICDSVDSTKAVDAPKNATTHIQNTAPGPPNAMAVATPTMFPVPTLPERAMQNASNDEIPSAPRFLLKRERTISPMRLTCTNRVQTEKNSPAPSSSTTSPGFQTILLIYETMLSNYLYGSFVPGFQVHPPARIG